MPANLSMPLDDQGRLVRPHLSEPGPRGQADDPAPNDEVVHPLVRSSEGISLELSQGTFGRLHGDWFEVAGAVRPWGRSM